MPTTSVGSTSTTNTAWQPPPVNFQSLGSTLADIDLGNADTLRDLTASGLTSSTVSDAVRNYLNSPQSEGKAELIRAQRNELVYFYGEDSQQVADFDEGVMSAVREKIGPIYQVGPFDPGAPPEEPGPVAEPSSPAPQESGFGVRVDADGVTVTVGDKRSGELLFQISDGKLTVPSGQQLVLPPTIRYEYDEASGKVLSRPNPTSFTLEDGSKLIYGTPIPSEWLDSDGRLDRKKVPEDANYFQLADGTAFEIIWGSSGQRGG